MASNATFDARYAVIITRHRTHSEQPAAVVDDGDQDANTTRGRPPPEPARQSTAALRSVGDRSRAVLPIPGSPAAPRQRCDRHGPHRAARPASRIRSGARATTCRCPDEDADRQSPSHHPHLPGAPGRALLRTWLRRELRPSRTRFAGRFRSRVPRGQGISQCDLRVQHLTFDETIDARTSPAVHLCHRIIGRQRMRVDVHSGSCKEVVASRAPHPDGGR